MEPPPIITAPDSQRSKDEEHLNLLATFHFVVAALGALFACVPFIHVGMGIMILIHPQAFSGGNGPAPPAFMGLFFIVLGGVFILLGWAMAICTFISGRFLRQRRNRMFSFIVAAILCMFMPFGTVLGVFTIIALSKDSVRGLYGEQV
jgi:hypothetical protein